MTKKTEIIPLVSIIVITYNSEKYILQTLESIRKQTYRKLELVVCDDCSGDHTPEICKNWILNNTSRFVRTEVIIAEQNTGISANCNRGLNSAGGKWIKLIAGDDMLLENCIESNITFVKKHSNASFIFSNGFTIDENGQSLGRITSDSRKLAFDSQGQYKELLKSAFVLTPSAFIRKDAISSLGGYNEKIPLLEDYPMWLNATRNGYKLFYLNEETVLYRKHVGSISAIKDNKKEIKDKERVMKMIVNLYDKKMLNDIFRFKLFSLYFHIKLVNRAHDAFTKGKNVKFYVYSFLRYCIPSFLIKGIIKKIRIVLH
jgi:alpha-1,3-rhamnosyltransferase